MLTFVCNGRLHSESFTASLLFCISGVANNRFLSSGFSNWPQWEKIRLARYCCDGIHAKIVELLKHHISLSLFSCGPLPLLNSAPVDPPTDPAAPLPCNLYSSFVFNEKILIILSSYFKCSSDNQAKEYWKFPTLFFFFNKIRWRPPQVVLEKGQKCLRDLDLLDFYFTGVALLPFVDEKRLLSALSEVYSDLTESESKVYFIIHRIFNCTNIRYCNLRFIVFCGSAFTNGSFLYFTNKEA